MSLSPYDLTETGYDVHVVLLTEIAPSNFGIRLKVGKDVGMGKETSKRHLITVKMRN